MVIRSDGGDKSDYYNNIRNSKGSGDGSGCGGGSGCGMGSSSGESYLAGSCTGRGCMSRFGDAWSVSINSPLFLISGRQTRFKIRQSS